jgi:biopolymer transport protein ExbD
MMDINTTPLIDVMLVLLIMFIITIPIQTHAVKLDLPVNEPNQTPPPIDPVKNKIVITPRAQVLWNGEPVDLVRLRQYLDLTHDDESGPRAASAARSQRALRAGRRGARGHQARPGHQDGLRRQRGLPSNCSRASRA